MPSNAVEFARFHRRRDVLRDVIVRSSRRRRILFVCRALILCAGVSWSGSHLLCRGCANFAFVVVVVVVVGVVVVVVCDPVAVLCT